MKPIWAIAKLTWKAAFRFRLFWALTTLMLLSVVVLPLMLKDDGTARGFIQILLTYNLSAITALLGFATLWLSCGTLSRDIEDCQMQLVVVKPVPRWQIWVGKWLGILFLNAALLAVSGLSVYALLLWRARDLPPDQQRILHEEIFVARAALREPPPDLVREAEKIFRDRLAEVAVPAEEHAFVRQQILEQLKAGVQIVPPGYLRRWEMDLGFRQHFLRDEPLFMRFRFHAAQTNATGEYIGLWQVGPPDSPTMVSHPMSLSADTFHEMKIEPNLYDADGRLVVEFLNRNETALLFPLEDGFEILYREGGFGLNFVRGLLVILSWMCLLSALGLAAGSLLSFPVAAFFSLSLLVVAFSGGTLSTVVEEGSVMGLDHETGEGGLRWLDTLMLPLFRGVLAILRLVETLSPVDALSAGRSITWGQLGLVWVQVVLLLGGILAAVGILVFNRRELALPQGNG